MTKHHRHLLLLTGMLLLNTWPATECAAQRGLPRLPGGYWYQQAQQMQNNQRQQNVAALRANLTQAREQLARIEAEAEATQSELSAAEGEVQSLREAAKDKEEALKASNKNVKSLEERILAQQPPGSEYAKAQLRVVELQEQVDSLARKILNLPAHSTEGKSGLMERARLTEAQKARLNADPEYSQAQSVAQTAATNLQQLRMKLYKESRDWQTATAERTTAQQAAKAADIELKKAELVAAKHRKALKSAHDMAIQAREVIATGELHLQKLGAGNPAQNAGSGKGSALKK
ncbi:hypothetical protein [Planctomicrobium sp. SH664]|uniref:hypothetical protein n=1 Tax=Planctomicrobium sp. SH664 TaxID=3448125 RepID=UPI003F5B2826